MEAPLIGTAPRYVFLGGMKELSLVQNFSKMVISLMQIVLDCHGTVDDSGDAA